MKIFVGSLVVCHILSGTPTPPTTAENSENLPKTKQMAGVVKEIFKEDVIETEMDNIPVKRKKTMFTVLLNDDKGLIKIAAEGCLPVLSENEYKSYQEKKQEYRKNQNPNSDKTKKESTKLRPETKNKENEDMQLIELNSDQRQELLKSLDK